MALSTATFRDQFNVFTQRLASASGEQFIGFQTGLPATWEGYKGRLRGHALERMDIAAWRSGDIGGGKLLEATIRGVEITRSPRSEANNFVRWEGRFGHANRSHRRLLEARIDPAAREAFEAALWAHFRGGEDAGVSFARLRNLGGARYDLLAYLFFLRDWDRFMPIATRTFDRAFAQLGLGLTMSYNASWENYQAYNSALGDIRTALIEVAGVADARLVDAHSFCWMLVRPEFVEGYAATRTTPHSQRDPGRSLNAREKSIVIMAQTAVATAKFANGQLVEVTKKLKDLLLTQQQLEGYLKELLAVQENRCALTGIPLQYHGEETDKALLPSLDRIDSDGHYARGNLQVVCRFVNMWKAATPDEEFRRQLALVRAGDGREIAG